MTLSLNCGTESLRRSFTLLYLLVQKSDSEETDGPKPHVKLRRAVSENPRPASTPPTMASADKEDREEDRIAAELEVRHHAARSHVNRSRAIRCSTTRKKRHLLFDSFPSDQIHVTTLSACRWQQQFARRRYHMFKQQVPYVTAALGGGGWSQKSHAAHPHPSSLWAHRSQADRWTLMMLCVRRSLWNNKFSHSQRKLLNKKKNSTSSTSAVHASCCKILSPPRQLFERAPPRLVLPCPGPELVSLPRRSDVSPCRLHPLPSEGVAAEVTLSLQRTCVLWVALLPCRPVWPSFPSRLSTAAQLSAS